MGLNVLRCRADIEGAKESTKNHFCLYNASCHKARHAPAATILFLRCGATACTKQNRAFLRSFLNCQAHLSPEHECPWKVLDGASLPAEPFSGPGEPATDRLPRRAEAVAAGGGLRVSAEDSREGLQQFPAVHAAWPVSRPAFRTRQNRDLNLLHAVCVFMGRLCSRS